MLIVILDRGFDRRVHPFPFDTLGEARDFVEAVEAVTPGRPTAIAELHFLGPNGER